MGKSIFISRPTYIDANFENAYKNFDDFLIDEKFIPRRLGRSDYSRKAPLQAVMDIIDECSGAIILGYPQIELHFKTKKSSDKKTSGFVFPTPWNQIEGALAFRSRCPVLVVAHTGISGGVFDHGITGEMVLAIDLSTKSWFQKDNFMQPYNDWKKEVFKMTIKPKNKK